MAEKDFLESIEEEIESHLETLDLDIGKRRCGDFQITIKNGTGDVILPEVTTLWVKLKDITFHINSPSEGTWEVTVTDIANKNKGVYHGKDLKYCVEYKVPDYKTGRKCQLKIHAVWSEKKDTTLKGTVCATV